MKLILSLTIFVILITTASVVKAADSSNQYSASLIKNKTTVSNLTIHEEQVLDTVKLIIKHGTYVIYTEDQGPYPNTVWVYICKTNSFAYRARVVIYHDKDYISLQIIDPNDSTKTTCKTDSVIIIDKRFSGVLYQQIYTLVMAQAFNSQFTDEKTTSMMSALIKEYADK